MVNGRMLYHVHEALLNIACLKKKKKKIKLENKKRLKLVSHQFLDLDYRLMAYVQPTDIYKCSLG